MRDADVVVVGAGVMGAATARSLARSGRDVVLLERFEIGHTRGSSHGASRVFRFSYGDSQYVRMAMQSLPLWRELEDEAGTEVLTLTGGLDVGPDVSPNATALGACGAGFEILDPTEAMRRHPGVFLTAADGVLFTPDSGVLAASRALSALIDSAVGHGAELRENTPALEVRVEDDRALIRTEAETIRSAVAVVTAGAWARGVLEVVGIDLPVRVTRETPMYFPLREAVHLPVVVEWTTPILYALVTPGMGLKSGEHGAGPVVDPDHPGEPDGAAVDRVAAWIRRRFPGVDTTPHTLERCLYTNTDDERFILERYGPIVVGSPCSGHGFKFAPLIGERLAALATGDRATIG